ncbi:hypothetical protein O9993_00415 [Vibrio lentus]|nr:hypothetical protein [Vibrio lentus]
MDATQTLTLLLDYLKEVLTISIQSRVGRTNGKQLVDYRAVLNSRQLTSASQCVYRIRAIVTLGTPRTSNAESRSKIVGIR